MATLTTRVLLLFGFICVFFTLAFCQSNDAVNVKLSLADGKTVYRSGEPVTLVLSFTSFREGFSADTHVEVAESWLDHITISPTAGAVNWRQEFFGDTVPASDVSVPRGLSSEAVDVKLALNDSYRFDLPGKYTVHVLTKRAGIRETRAAKYEPPLELATNDVTFEIRPMSEAEEAAEVTRLAAALDAATDLREQIRLAKQISYLAGDAATGEKVRRYLASRNGGQYRNYAGSMMLGIYISRNKSLIIKELESALNDLTKPVDFEIVSMLSSIRARQEIAASGKRYAPPKYGAPVPADDPYARANGYYLNIVIDSLQKREGKSRNETAYALLRTQRDRLTPEMIASLRSTVLKNFDSLDMFSREDLLGFNWEQIRDPSLVPSIERMLKDNSYPQYGRINVKGTALKRLKELDPAKARLYMAAEIKDPNSILYDEVLDEFDGTAIPEADQPLLEQIGILALQPSGRNMVMLRFRCELAAKFASDAIYEPLLDIYKKYSVSWQPDTRGISLGYFARYKPKETLPAVEDELKRIDPQLSDMMLNALTKYNYPMEIAAFFESRLNSDNLAVTGQAAYTISQHGTVKDRIKIEARLKQWVERWNERYFELEGPQLKPEYTGQAQLQVNLIMALLLGKAWKLTEADKDELRAHCLSSTCKQAFHW